MEIPADNALTDVTVWYDGDCPLCMREINLMRRLDKRRAINFVEIQTAGACPVDTDTLIEEQLKLLQRANRVTSYRSPEVQSLPASLR